jgi:hypothetical protein
MIDFEMKAIMDCENDVMFKLIYFHFFSVIAFFVRNLSRVANLPGIPTELSSITNASKIKIFVPSPDKFSQYKINKTKQRVDVEMM